MYIYSISIEGGREFFFANNSLLEGQEIMNILILCSGTCPGFELSFQRKKKDIFLCTSVSFQF